jgi:hypothetical protein
MPLLGIIGLACGPIIALLFVWALCDIARLTVHPRLREPVESEIDLDRRLELLKDGEEEGDAYAEGEL